MSNKKPSDEDSALRDIYENLIHGSHILHHHGILDAYGHLSARHPTDPELFIMPRNMAPATITKPTDLVIYQVSDASPVDENAPRGYIERFIHSEIYRAYPHVKSALHSHTAAVLPYANSDVPFKASLHMGGFLGLSTPVFDISNHYAPNDEHDLLIRNANLGKHLASCFAGNQSPNTGATDHCVVLMRGHGYTVTAPSIQECVFRGIYTTENAKIQTDTLLLAAAHSRVTGNAVRTMTLCEDEIEDAGNLGAKSGERAWGLWLHEIAASPLYKYEGD